MNIETLAAFFAWCTVTNGSLLIFWTAALMLVPDRVYATQRRWFPIPRETFKVVIYEFLGLFKTLFLVLNLVPYLALRIILAG
jgi:hypothetical protein